MNIVNDGEGYVKRERRVVIGLLTRFDMQLHPTNFGEDVRVGAETVCSVALAMLILLMLLAWTCSFPASRPSMDTSQEMVNSNMMEEVLGNPEKMEQARQAILENPTLKQAMSQLPGFTEMVRFRNVPFLTPAAKGLVFAGVGILGWMKNFRTGLK